LFSKLLKNAGGQIVRGRAGLQAGVYGGCAN
jgi:hypothetical protein